jgi:hypothetical protein
MRSLDTISQIKNNIAKPRQVDNYIDNAQEYVDWFYKSNNKTYKNTGPVSINEVQKTGLLDRLVERLKEDFGDFFVRSALIYKTDRPHVIHNDDDLEYKLPYKAFNIPLYVDGDDSQTKLIMFNQFYYYGPGKFFKNDKKNRPVYYNIPITDYTNVDGLEENKKIDIKFYKEYLSHLKLDWLEGLSVNSVLDWQVGNLLEFDSTRLHSSNNWLDKGIKYKIGLTIFTCQR